MSKEYIRSAFNYTGGKYRLLPQIFPLFPKRYDRFIDLFAGGASVGINSDPNKELIINDANLNVISFYKFLKNCDPDVVIEEIEKVIELYQLSNTKKNNYECYIANSADGLGKVNREAFLVLRNEFNTKGISRLDRNIAFYLLTVYGFNNQIRFNRKGEFNLLLESGILIEVWKEN